MQKKYGENKDNDCKECNTIDPSISSDNETSTSAVWNPLFNKKTKPSAVKISVVKPSNLTQLPLESIHTEQFINLKEGLETEEKPFINTQAQQDMIANSFKGDKSSLTMDDMINYYKKIVKFIAGIVALPMIWVNDVTLYISSKLCKILSNNATDEDIELVKSKFKILLSVLISYYIVYNWYFVMFFKDAETGLRINTLDLSMETLMQIKPLDYIFKYILCVISTVDWLLLTKYPTQMKDFTPQFNFILLLLIIIFVVTNMGESIMSDFSTYLSMEKTGYTGSFIAFSVFYGVYSFVMEFTDKITKEPSIAGFLDAFNKANHYRIFGILHVIAYIMRIIWSTMIHYIWGLLIILYLLVMSFFSIFIFSYSKHGFSSFNHISTFIDESLKEVMNGGRKFSMGKKSSMSNSLFSGMEKFNKLTDKIDDVGNTLNKIDDVSKNTLNKIDNVSKNTLNLTDKLGDVGKSSIFNKIGNLVSMGSKANSIFEIIINIIYRYIFEIIMIISVLSSMSAYGVNIEDFKLRLWLISLNFIIILLILCFIYNRYTILNKLIKTPTEIV